MAVELRGEMAAGRIGHMFAALAKASPDRVALMTAKETVTYGELYSHASQIAERFKDLHGQPVAIFDCEKIEFVVRMMAAALIPRPAMTFDPEQPRKPLPLRDYTAISAYPDEFYWGLTSGSTGEPKVFARTQASWVASFEACESVFPFRDGEVVMAPGALTHSLFLYATVHALARGHTVILPPRFSARGVVRRMREQNATVLYAVPSMLEELVAAGMNDLKLRYVFCGGAKLSGHLRRRVERAAPRADVIEFYGASELSFVTYASTRHPAPEGSVGRLFPSVEMETRTSDGGRAPLGSKGAIYVSSPMLFARYLGEAPLRRGAFATAGDLGYMDAEGFLYLTGRADREINTKGYKVSPEVVEAALIRHPHVRRAAVVGLVDEKRGAIVAAAVELTEGASVGRAELSGHCRSLLADADCPQLYFHAQRLPLTRTGKVAFGRVRQDLEGDAVGYEAMR